MLFSKFQKVLNFHLNIVKLHGIFSLKWDETKNQYYKDDIIYTSKNKFSIFLLFNFTLHSIFTGTRGMFSVLFGRENFSQNEVILIGIITIGFVSGLILNSFNLIIPSALTSVLNVILAFEKGCEKFQRKISGKIFLTKFLSKA